MIGFLLFKSKSFISFNSPRIKKRASQRNSSILQTTIIRTEDDISYEIHNVLHREELNNNIFFSCIDTNSSWNFPKLARPQELYFNSGRILPTQIETYMYTISKWYKNGKLHRNEKIEGCTLPADVDEYCGYRGFFKNGKFHREDKALTGDVKNGYYDKNGNYVAYTMPAIQNPANIPIREWYNNGERHRDDRDENGYLLPAIIGEWKFYSREFYKNDKLHRDDVIKDGIYGEYDDVKKTFNNLLPACINSYNVEWWIEGECIHSEKINWSYQV